ncbi:MAG: FAD-binding protein [Candidatus Woesearchaeota archaeon]|nr:FAD-binding protein [Candidatus Woesearchaeota archaeon]
MMFILFGDSYEVIIVGSGIAGSALAYHMHPFLDYLIFTDQKSPMRNTSSFSYGHCRVISPEGLEEIVRRSVSQLGEDREKMNFVYMRTHYVTELLDELSIGYIPRSFGVIPSGRRRGGPVILERIQKKIPYIKTDVRLLGFTRDKDRFEVSLRTPDGEKTVKTDKLVIATGGYAGSFDNTDNFRYKNYSIFDMVRMNGGNIINLDCIFTHPFGYDRGRRILIGKDAKKGDFVDKRGRFVFNKKIRSMIKEDRYHEIFHLLLAEADECRARGSQVYFVSGSRREEITPCVHYTSGGIETNYLGEVKGCRNLFAVGECQANGSKNNGRFPGYPFTSAIVYGKELARHLSDSRR